MNLLLLVWLIKQKNKKGGVDVSFYCKVNSSAICSLIALDESLKSTTTVQWVNRPNSEIRGFSGRISAGFIKRGDEIKIFPSGQLSHVDRIISFDGDLSNARDGQSVTLTLRDNVDCSRGQVIVKSDSPIEEADQFDATIITKDKKPLNVRELAGLIKKSQFVIANDTGPAHMAAHLGKSGLVLFGYHTTAKKVSIETDNFKAITVSKLQDLSVTNVYNEFKKNFLVN